MKKNYLIIVVLVLSLVTSGCVAEMQGQNITIQKRVGDENRFEEYKKVTKRKQVRKAIEIVKKADWEHVKVEMERYADYQLQFPLKGSGEDKIANYLLWVSPNGEQVEIIADSERYVRLTKEDSLILYEILTGEEL